MAQVQKIDSNTTGLAYAVEENLGTLPASPVWNRLQPNSYSDFGGDLSTVAPNPINPSRQRRKGVQTDLDSSGGFNHDLTFFNIQELLESVFFADMRKKARSPVTAVTSTAFTVPSGGASFATNRLVKGFNFSIAGNNGVHVVSTSTSTSVNATSLTAEAAPPANARIQVVGHQFAAGDLEVDASGDLPLLTSSSVNLTTLGLVVGQWIFVGGDTSSTQYSNAANNGFKRVRSISSGAITLDKSAMPMVTQTGSTETIRIFFGDVLRNETGTMIKRKSFHLERTLGAPDTSQPNEIQSEFLRGALPNEFTLNVPTADLVRTDFNFFAIDNDQRTADQGPLQTSVLNPQAADVFNTSSDFSRIKMAVVSNVNEAPAAMFAFITEATITINNNLTANKAVGTFGAFDMTAGTFTVSGSVTAYFASVEAIQAVRQNSDVTLDMVMVKNNQGIAVDIPLVALGDGRLNVEMDQPITLPLSMDAATAEDVAPGMDHTALITFFAYLPNAAD